MNLLENLSRDNHLRTCGTTDVTTLFVNFHFAFALSQSMDSNILLQEVISTFQI